MFLFSLPLLLLLTAIIDCFEISQLKRYTSHPINQVTINYNHFVVIGFLLSNVMHGFTTAGF
jgi:hypothetical protein